MSKGTLPQNIPSFDMHPSEATELDDTAALIVLGNFQITARIGEGTYATAYLAKQVGTDRDAVVKIAHPHLIHGHMSELIRRRFEIELRASTRVKHPNVVTIYTAGDVDGAPAIAMEYVEGKTLEQHLGESAPMTERMFVEIFSQLANALAALHREQIIHRDVSPRNIVLQPLMAGSYRAKLLDFGISQLDGNTRHTAGPIGTPQFMAPEILKGETSSAVDIFSLGLLMWWGLTGEPFIEEGSDQYAVFKLLSSMDRAPSFDGKALHISAEIRRIVQRALSPEPLQRPSAMELAAVLSEYVSMGPRESAEHQSLMRHRSSSPETSGRRSHVLVLTSEEVSARLVRDALPVHVTYTLCKLKEWRARFSSLSSFDAVYVPLTTSQSEHTRYVLLDLVAERTLTASTVKIFAYSHELIARDSWRRLGVDETWVLPAEASSLHHTLQNLSTKRSPWERAGSDALFRSLEEDSIGTRQVIDEFIGGMPEWLLELETALDLTDRARLFTLCGELSSRAMSVGAENIITITRKLCELPANAYLSQGFALVQELESEYKLLFTELSTLRRS